MRKAIKNLVIGVIAAVSVFGTSLAAFASTQFVQTDMNFRSGASKTASVIGSVPAGAQVDFQRSENGWDLVTYNGKTGYIHGGNLGNSYTAPKKTQTPASNYSSTQNYFDNNWSNRAADMNNNAGNSAWKTVKVDSGYLALRNDATYDASNEIGQLNTGDTVEIQGTKAAGSYVYVYSPKYDTLGWVNAGFLQ